MGILFKDLETLFLFRFLRIFITKIEKWLKKTSTRAVFKLYALSGYICLCILLAAIRQQNYTLIFLTQQRNHCWRLRENRKKSRWFVRFFSSKKKTDLFRFSTMKYSAVNLQRAAASPNRISRVFSPDSWTFPRPIADCIPCSALIPLLLVPVEIKASHKSRKPVRMSDQYFFKFNLCFIFIITIINNKIKIKLNLIENKTIQD